MRICYYKIVLAYDYIRYSIVVKQKELVNYISKICLKMINKCGLLINANASFQKQLVWAVQLTSISLESSTWWRGRDTCKAFGFDMYCTEEIRCKIQCVE